jgi:hypothetical protein
MSNYVVNVGHRDYGYAKVEPLWKRQLEHYVDNVAAKYDEKFVKENVEIAKDIMAGKKINWSKFAKIAALFGIATIAFADLTAIPVSAAPIQTASVYYDIVDLDPLKRFTSEIWITMLKAFGYISVPMLGWSAWQLFSSGTDQGKRTTAKIMVVSIIGGFIFLAAAPWAGEQLDHLVHRIFSKYMTA